MIWPLSIYWTSTWPLSPCWSLSKFLLTLAFCSLCLKYSFLSTCLNTSFPSVLNLQITSSERRFLPNHPKAAPPHLHRLLSFRTMTIPFITFITVSCWYKHHVFFFNFISSVTVTLSCHLLFLTPRIASRTALHQIFIESNICWVNKWHCEIVAKVLFCLF